jgi:hypothetical protein
MPGFDQLAMEELLHAATLPDRRAGSVWRDRAALSARMPYQFTSTSYHFRPWQAEVG